MDLHPPSPPCPPSISSSRGLRPPPPLCQNPLPPPSPPPLPASQPPTTAPTSTITTTVPPIGQSTTSYPTTLPTLLPSLYPLPLFLSNEPPSSPASPYLHRTPGLSSSHTASSSAMPTSLNRRPLKPLQLIPRHRTTSDPPEPHLPQTPPPHFLLSSSPLFFYLRPPSTHLRQASITTAAFSPISSEVPTTDNSQIPSPSSFISLPSSRSQACRPSSHRAGLCLEVAALSLLRPEENPSHDRA